MYHGSWSKNCPSTFSVKPLREAMKHFVAGSVDCKFDARDTHA